jgi:hypothetical protein
VLDAAALLRYLPFLQAVHASCALDGWNWPKGHSAHATASLLLVADDVRSLPAAQSVQSTEAGIGWKRPVWHVVQLIAAGVDAGLKWPAAQARHLPPSEPPHAVWYWPAGQR